MKTGRDREVEEIVAHDRAVEVADLLMGKLNRPIRAIFPEAYRSKLRRQLRSGVQSLKAGKAKALSEWCSKNFSIQGYGWLNALYERLYQNDSRLRLSLKDFASLIGQPQEGVLRDSPRHSTIVISPWGLQTEYPEWHLARDLAIAFNEALSLDAQLRGKHGTPWSKIKQNETRNQIGDLEARCRFHSRMCLLSAFNLIEAYINGIAFEFTESHDISVLSKNKQDLLTSGQASILEKLVKVPEIAADRSPGPLTQDQDPLKEFREMIKPFRDSIVHASPFSAPARFGGYDKLSKVYELAMPTVENAVDLTLDMIGRVHKFVTGRAKPPHWVPSRNDDGSLRVADSKVDRRAT